MIRPGDTTHRIEWRRRGCQQKVSPDVRHDTYTYPQEHSITPHRSFDVQAHAAAMICQHIFAPLLHPFHGLSEAQGEIGDQHIFGEDAVFDTKTAADIRRDHPQCLFRLVQQAAISSA